MARGLKSKAELKAETRAELEEENKKFEEAEQRRKTAKIYAEKSKKKEETRKLLEEEEKSFKKAADLSAASEREFVFFQDEDFERDDKDDEWYSEFKKGLEDEKTEYYLSPAQKARQKVSDSVYNRYTKGEKWLMSEGEDDLAKALFNNFRSAIGSTVEDVAYIINDYAPWYKPAKNVLEKNMAGEIEEKAKKQFENVKKIGVNENLVDFMDSFSKGAGYSIFGSTLGGYIDDVGSSLDIYRKMREQGYSKSKAKSAAAKEGATTFLINKANDYGIEKIRDLSVNGIVGKNISDDVYDTFEKEKKKLYKSLDNLEADPPKKCSKKKIQDFEKRMKKAAENIEKDCSTDEDIIKRFEMLQEKVNNISMGKEYLLNGREYGHIMSEVMTNTPYNKWGKGDFSKAIGDNIYEVNNKSSSEFTVKSKKPLHRK